MNLLEKLINGHTLTSEEFNDLFENYQNYNIDDDFLLQYADRILWSAVFRYYPLSEEMLYYTADRIVDNIHRLAISMYQKLSEGFMEQHSLKLLWPFLSVNQKMSEDFIIRNADKIDFAYLPYNQKISITALEKTMKADNVNWRALSRSYPLTNEFILEFFKYLDTDLLRFNKALNPSDDVKLLLELNN